MRTLSLGFLLCAVACSSSSNGDGGTTTGGTGGNYTQGGLLRVNRVQSEAGDQSDFSICLDGPAVMFANGARCDNGATCCVTIYSGSGECPSDTNAGTLTLVDGTATLATAAWSPQVGDYPSMDIALTQTVAGGDSLMVTASGAVIPAFNATVTASPDSPILSPVAPSGGLAVSASQDLVVTWTGQSTPSPSARFIVQLNFFEIGYVACYPKDSDGTVTLPAAMLGQLAGVLADAGSGATGLLKLSRQTPNYDGFGSTSIALDYSYTSQLTVTSLQ